MMSRSVEVLPDMVLFLRMEDCNKEFLTLTLSTPVLAVLRLSPLISVIGVWTHESDISSSALAVDVKASVPIATDFKAEFVLAGVSASVPKSAVIVGVFMPLIVGLS
ncbi:hypothetical protein WICPIJ_008903 [Wickerhamomyces pijperi]|uniref:Uncharacterized protein n=1 Tax=Wickerhamomyces pijperi TaxID=599730 RepID=A0A9P8TGW1_WICPI|nr:hypothetical protein WICPIJ_008903 [Wickerhamomyces pijperi]